MRSDSALRGLGASKTVPFPPKNTKPASGAPSGPTGPNNAVGSGCFQTSLLTAFCPICSHSCLSKCQRCLSVLRSFPVYGRAHSVAPVTRIRRLAGLNAGTVLISSRAFCFFLIATILVALVPLWVPEYLPLGDFPSHLSTCYVISHYDDVGFFRQCYELVREPIPNLGQEFVIVPLLAVLDVQTAGKIFLSLGIGLFTIGVYLLARNKPDNRGKWFALVAPFLFYCNQLFWGTINFLFGVGVFFIAFALWDRFRKQWTPLRWIVILLLAPVVYLVHLSAYAFLGVASVIAVAVEMRRERRLDLKRHAVSMLPLLPPLILYRLFMSGTGRLGEVVWATAKDKVIAVFPFFIHVVPIDAAMLLLLGLAIGLTLYYRRALRIDTLYITSAIAFGVLFLVCPRILYTSSGSDVRFVLPTWIFLLLAIDWQASRLVARFVLASAITVLIARNVVLTSEWREGSARVAEQVELLRILPPESRMYADFGFTDRETVRNRAVRPLMHVASYATIERGAFTNSVIAIRGQQPLVLRDTLADRMSMDTSSNHQWQYAVERFDYIWYCGMPGSYPPALRGRSDSIGTKGYGEIWKVRR